MQGLAVSDPRIPVSWPESLTLDPLPPLSQDTDPEGPSLLACAVCLDSVLPHRDPVLLSGCKSHLLCRPCAESLPPPLACPTCRKEAETLVPLADTGFGYLQYMNIRVGCPGKCGKMVAISDLGTHYSNCPAFNCQFCGKAVKLPDTIEVL